MRNHAGMARRQLRTKDYSAAARKALGEAVDAARRAAGYRFRTDFVRAHGIRNLRGLEMLEQGLPGVGQATLLEVARALPGWDENTPRAILEGGDPPSISENQVAASNADTAHRHYSRDDVELAVMLARRGQTDDDIFRTIETPQVAPRVEPPNEPRTGTDR
jgi:hypothetical protein